MCTLVGPLCCQSHPHYFSSVIIILSNKNQSRTSPRQLSWQALGQSEIKIIASVRETHASPLRLLYHSLRYKSTNIIPRRFLFQSLIRHTHKARPDQSSVGLGSAPHIVANGLRPSSWSTRRRGAARLGFNRSRDAVVAALEWSTRGSSAEASHRIWPLCRRAS